MRTDVREQKQSQQTARMPYPLEPAGGHTAPNAPDLFRPPNLSGAGPGKYWGGGTAREDLRVLPALHTHLCANTKASSASCADVISIGTRWRQHRVECTAQPPTARTTLRNSSNDAGVHKTSLGFEPRSLDSDSRVLIPSAARQLNPLSLRVTATSAILARRLGTPQSRHGLW